MSRRPAPTTVHNLAYAQRLGLWGGEDFPFATRAEFVEAIEDGGVAAMEVLARDLRRSASTLRARSPMTASNTSWSSTRSPTSSAASTTPMPGRSRSSINHLDAAMEAANITGATAR